MKSKQIGCLLGALLCCVIASERVWAESNWFGEGKKGILVVSFGTSHLDTMEKTIAAVERRIAKTFDSFEVRRAFTSLRIIEKLKKKYDMHVDKPEEALMRMFLEGFSTVIVQPTHLLAGEEYNNKILSKLKSYRWLFPQLHFGRPVMYYMADYDALVDALQHQVMQMNPSEIFVWMGHGSHHPSNAAYPCLQSKIADRHLPMLVGTVEGYPEIDWIVDRLKRDRVQTVTLAPLMLVAGDHAKNDMAGEEEDSWKSILLREGLQVEIYLHGLGENELFQDIYVRSIHDVLARIKQRQD